MMKVETYEIEPEVTAGFEVEDREEVTSLIEAMNLAGQRELLTKGENTATRLPYRLITKEERFVYGELCPEITEIEDYRGEAIPVRVLRVAKQYRPEFARIEVWHKASANVKDPVLVGVMKDPESTWREHIYILARWGNELEDLAILKAKAIQQWKDKYIDKCKEMGGAVDAALARIDSRSDEAVIENNNLPSYHHIDY